MGTKQTRLAKIARIRKLIKEAQAIEAIEKKRLIAKLVLEGSSKRTISELVQVFIDSGEVKEIEGKLVCIEVENETA